MSPDRLLLPTEAAEFLSLSPRTLERWRVTGGGPRFIKAGGKSVRYRPADLLAWIDGQSRSHTHEAA